MPQISNCIKEIERKLCPWKSSGDVVIKELFCKRVLQLQLSESHILLHRVIDKIKFVRFRSEKSEHIRSSSSAELLWINITEKKIYDWDKKRYRKWRVRRDCISGPQTCSPGFIKPMASGKCLSNIVLYFLGRPYGFLFDSNNKIDPARSGKRFFRANWKSLDIPDLPAIRIFIWISGCCQRSSFWSASACLP